jgi:hypothetical protein
MTKMAIFRALLMEMSHKNANIFTSRTVRSYAMSDWKYHNICPKYLVFF